MWTALKQIGMSTHEVTVERTDGLLYATGRAR